MTNDPSMTTASHNLLSQIFTDDFLASIGKEEGQRIWYNTADGTKRVRPIALLAPTLQGCERVR